MPIYLLDFSKPIPCWLTYELGHYLVQNDQNHGNIYYQAGHVIPLRDGTCWLGVHAMSRIILSIFRLHAQNELEKKHIVIIDNQLTSNKNILDIFSYYFKPFSIFMFLKIKNVIQIIVFNLFLSCNLKYIFKKRK